MAEMDKISRYVDDVVSRAIGEPAVRSSLDDAGSTTSRSPVEAHTVETMGTQPPPSMGLRPARWSRFKRLLLWLVRPLTRYLNYLNANVHASIASIDQRVSALSAGLASGELLVEQAVESLESLRTELNVLRQDVADVDQRRTTDRTEMNIQRSRVDLLLKEVRRRLSPLGDSEVAGFLERVGDPVDPFYADFETRFRGTREEIRERQRIYLDSVAALGGQTHASVFDLGPGRGEWLELLRESGIHAYGVDTNKVFVDECWERGLDVRHEDAIDHLKKLPEGTLGAVTAFHVLEHLTFTDVVDVVDGALRALRPGGLVIFETPNPLTVIGASCYHLDPTHKAPLHPLFLEFLLTARGFIEVEVNFLHPSPDPPLTIRSFDGPQAEELQLIVDALNWMLVGPLDYSVVGRKAPSAPD